MAQLYFKYGAMGSSKSANALMARFNYEERGQKTLLVKPQLDTRDGDHMVYSRIGLKHPCVYFHEMQAMAEEELKQFACIIVDECQFLTSPQIDQLRAIVNDYNIPVQCFGLRTDFQTRLFPGSKRLFELADSTEEIKYICSCMEKAVVNSRMDAFGNIITQGAQVEIGGNERYEAMCWRCWNDRIGARVDVEF
jgi:thymidine kinase